MHLEILQITVLPSPIRLLAPVFNIECKRTCQHVRHWVLGKEVLSYMDIKQ